MCHLLQLFFSKNPRKNAEPAKRGEPWSLRLADGAGHISPQSLHLLSNKKAADLISSLQTLI